MVRIIILLPSLLLGGCGYLSDWNTYTRSEWERVTSSAGIYMGERVPVGRYIRGDKPFSPFRENPDVEEVIEHEDKDEYL